jgi:glucose/arabinose dehydrogenase
MHTARTAALILAATLATPALAQSYTATQVLSGLARPVQVLPIPGDPDRLIILEQRSGATGRVRVYNRATGTLLPTPFLSVGVATSSEQGLLGMTFHPDYETNGLFYINYTRPGGDTVIAEYAVSATNPDQADAGSARIVLVIDQPFTNHNAGWIAFGPDGYLYVPTGDGGSANDPGNSAQNLSIPLGKILRLDVDSGDDFPGDLNRNFAIPDDNPFRSTAGADPAVWSFGLRNPYRNDFDPATGDLYLADVGQSEREEINHQPAFGPGGENYGWRCVEGTRPTNLCTPPAGAIPPVAEYSHNEGCSVTGGIVVRGCAIPSLDGAFIYADYCSNQVWTTRFNGASWTTSNITSQIAFNGLSSISSFGRDADGNLYATNLFGGSVYIFSSDDPSADLNDDGVIDFGDVADFVTAFNALDPAADLNNDSVVDFGDVGAFVDAFNLGC